jgi:hypothetical protein
MVTVNNPKSLTKRKTQRLSQKKRGSKWRTKNVRHQAEYGAINLTLILPASINAQRSSKIHESWLSELRCITKQSSFEPKKVEARWVCFFPCFISRVLNLFHEFRNDLKICCDASSFTGGTNFGNFRRPYWKCAIRLKTRRSSFETIVPGHKMNLYSFRSN